MSEAATVVPLHPTPATPPTPPKNIPLRVLIHGEVDVNAPENADEDALARAIANDIKTKNPSFKITKILIAHGTGPIATPL